MLHLLYILAFTIIAFLAIGNLIRSLLTLGMEARQPTTGWNATGNRPMSRRPVPHPEFLDEAGVLIDEPLLVMKSMTVDDAREQLDALYKSSPSSSTKGDDAEPV